jgi:hypothetical protein
VPLSQRSWRPLLDGALAEKARAVIAEIDAALREPVSDPSLMGSAGAAGTRARWSCTSPTAASPAISRGFFDPRTEELAWGADRSFVNGTCGIGLSLLAATSTLDPAWDRLLAASLA